MAFSSWNGSLKYIPKFFLPIDHRYRNVWIFFYLWIINSKKKRSWIWTYTGNNSWIVAVLVKIAVSCKLGLTVLKYYEHKKKSLTSEIPLPHRKRKKSHFDFEFLLNGCKGNIWHHCFSIHNTHETEFFTDSNVMKIPKMDHAWSVMRLFFPRVSGITWTNRRYGCCS